MPKWRLLFTPPAHGAWNMAADESILEHIHRGESPSTLRLYAWNPPCLSLGHAQPFADVDLARVKERGWEVVRRLTGGRAILHADELTYSVAGSADDPLLAGSVLESYNRIAQALTFAARELGLSVEMKADRVSNAPHNANPVCFEVPSAYEITANGKKLIGSAQARKKEGVLQHGSFPLTGDLTRICEALVFDDDSARETAKQRLLARAVTAESVLGRGISWETATRSFIRGFEIQNGINFQRGEMSQSELKRTDELVKEKYDHPSWTERI